MIRKVWPEPDNKAIDLFDKLHGHVVSRRDFLSASIATTLSGFMPSIAEARKTKSDMIGPWQSEILHGARCGLWLKRNIAGTWVETTPESTTYRIAGVEGIQKEGWARLCDLMRDTRANRVTYMDVNLFDTLVCLQQWCWYYGVRSPLIITSGFRTRKTNNNIEGAARNSLHMRGKAADIRSPDIDGLMLSRMGVILQMGGVGFYPAQNFTHIDSGATRRWGKKAFERML